MIALDSAKNYTIICYCSSLRNAYSRLEMLGTQELLHSLDHERHMA
jgi:hypothetical protein